MRLTRSIIAIALIVGSLFARYAFSWGAGQGADAVIEEKRLIFVGEGPLDVRFVIRPPASTALDKPRGLWDLVDVVTENNLIRAIVTWMSPMPFPFAETVALTDLQRAQLESLVRAGSTPQALVFPDPTGLQVLKKCRVSVRRHFCHPTSFQGRGCENGRSTEDPASGS